ncbi:hypothetical protein NBZ79_09410 [Sneathiella marina]|uniref:Glycerophosphoryl diester phosphodiesterase membrane domain-containing protein n=1 Tax=Sneathiella marina TaxID=2950108 RepID=A0ABY4W7P5_9PROT|nr:hypothetical protein [Sneathiella marina]USG63192.1 hypothetical protein NBZ79_09410 [Sneathiella marina]
MYLQSLKLTWRLYPYVLLAVVGELVVRVLAEQEIGGNSSKGFTITLLYSVLAFFAHVDILFPDPHNRAEAIKRFVGFMLRYMGLIFLIVLIAGGLTFFLYYGLEIASGGDRDERVGMLALIMLPLAGLFSLLIFGFMGTWMPAFVVDRQRGVGKAIARGRSTFWYVTGRLIFGPGLLFVLSLSAFAFIPTLAGLPETYFQTGWQPNISTFVYSAVTYVLQAWAIVMTAWIFSRAFLKAEASHAEAQA